MYAPGFRWRPWVSASFAWQAWDNVHCWWLLRGRRGTLCSHSFTLIQSLSLISSLTHSLNHSYTHSHHFTSLRFTSLHFTSFHFTSLTHSLTFSFTHLCMRIHTHIHKNSPTITPPSLLYFLFPSCFSMLSLSLEKLVTCGVIRSYNLHCFCMARTNIQLIQLHAKMVQQIQLTNVHS
jgi:hypothetical protein